MTCRVVLLAGLVAATWLPPAWSQPPDDAIASAQARLAAGDPRGALQAVDALPGGAAVASFDLAFVQGVAWQELASATTGDERDRALDRARAAYERALALRPDAPAVFNNLGALAADRGDVAAARRWYERAAAATGPRQGFYALNQARFLLPHDPGAALVAARRAVDIAPDSGEARAVLAHAYVRAPTSDALAPYLARTIAEGRTRLALDAALDALEVPAPARSADQRAELLALAAAALARDPALLAEQPAGWLTARLARLVADPQVGAGSRQWADLLQRTPADAQAIGWWGWQRVTALDTTRRAVVRELARALGETHAATAPPAAERWLRLAVALGDEGPDPEAFLRLVDLLVNTGRAAEVQALMQRYQSDLFSEKSLAYQRGDWRQIYRMHLALGMTYAHMKVWTSATPYQNAVFQLENAERAATRFNDAAQRQGRPERLALPPAAVAKLDEAYRAVGRVDQATALRLRSAEQLQRFERPLDAAQVLATFTAGEVAALSAANRTRFDRLRSTLPN